MLYCFVFVESHPRRSSRLANVQTCQRSNVLTSFTPKSLRLNLFADPHPLNLCATIFYKKGGGRGVLPSGPLFYPAFHLPYALPSSVSCKSFICHSYENTGGVGVFFPFWNGGPQPAPSTHCPSNSHGIISFADPHPLTIIESYRFENRGREAFLGSQHCNLPPANVSTCFSLLLKRTVAFPQHGTSRPLCGAPVPCTIKVHAGAKLASRAWPPHALWSLIDGSLNGSTPTASESSLKTLWAH